MVFQSTILFLNPRVVLLFFMVLSPFFNLMNWFFECVGIIHSLNLKFGGVKIIDLFLKCKK